MPFDGTGYADREATPSGRETRNSRIAYADATQTAGTERQNTSKRTDISHGPIVERFKTTESVEARARRKKKHEPRMVNWETDQTASGEYDPTAWHTNAGAQVRWSKRLVKRGDVIGKGVRSASRTGDWMLLSAVGFVCLWKFVFMLIALSLYTLGQIRLFWGAFSLDEAAETITQPLVWLGIMEEGARISTLGIGMWAVVILIVVISYAVLILYYWIARGIDVFGSVAAFLATTVAIIFDLVPPLNIFPWMLLWVLFINANSLFLTKHSPVRRA